MKRSHLTRLTIACFIVFAASALLSLSSCHRANTHAPHSPLIVAHRGGATLGMENSLSCIEQGILTGADMIEIDVHLTADRQVVVCHDFTLNRTTDAEGDIQDHTLSQLRQCHLLTKEGTPSEETIPTLNEVLLLCKDRCPILLEIKKKQGYNEGIEQLCIDLVKRHGMENQVVFQSFDAESMAIVHAIDPLLPTELLLGRPFAEEVENDSLFKTYLDTHFAHIRSLNVHYSMATNEYIRRVHQAGREIKIWTLDQPESAPEHVDAIITNTPDLFLK